MSQHHKNYLFLPALLMICLTSWLYLKHNWLLLLIVFLLGCIYRVKSFSLLVITFLCGFFLCLRTIIYCQDLMVKSEKFESVLTLSPDTVNVNGDQLKFIGRHKKQAFQCFYKLKEPKEKALWEANQDKLKLTVVGKVRLPKEARNLKGFDFRHYYHSQGISGQLEIEGYRIVEKRTAGLSTLRRKLISHNKQTFPTQIALYANALILGAKDQDFQEISAIYRGHGLLHLFSLSGLHIQIYLGTIELLLKRLKIFSSSRFLILIGFSYGVLRLTGASISIQRAVFSFMLARSMNKYSGYSALDRWSIMVISLLFFSPLLFFSVSGRLSIGIAYLLIFLRKVSPLQHSFLLSLMMIPLLLLEFSEWPPLSAVMNLIFLPMFSCAFLPVLIILFMGSLLIVWPPVVVDVSEKLLFLWEQFLSKVAVGEWIFGKPEIHIFVWLLIISGILCHAVIYQRRKLFVGSVTLFMLIIFFFSKFTPGMIAFVDVGQGDSIFIQLPFQKETFLIDTGGQLKFERQAWQQRKHNPASDYNLLPFLKAHGISQIDHVILTHNDSDHLGEIDNLLANIKVRQLYIGEGAQSDSKIQPLLRRISLKTTLKQVKKGDSIGKYQQFKVLYPEKSQGGNDDSVVLIGRIQQKTFLFTGDLETTGEKVLLETYPDLKIDILKVGHHGSNTSTSELFLDRLQPQTAVISVGESNRFGHPTSETLKKLQQRKVEIYRTDQQGMITYTWWFDKMRPATQLDFSDVK